MSHQVTILDIKTDILRAITSTFSKEGLNDKNHKYFLKSALSKATKLNLDKEKKNIITRQIAKYKKNKGVTFKSREDLLLITSLI